MLYIYIYIYVIYIHIIQYINIPGLVIHNGFYWYLFYLSQRSSRCFGLTQDPGKSSMNAMHSLSVLHSCGLQSPLLLLDLMQPGWMAPGCVWKCCVPHCTQWFCWSLSLLNDYFIGNIPYFQTNSLVMRKNVLLGWEPEKNIVGVIT